MATISREETNRIAYLSYIRLNDKALNEITRQLGSVLNYAVCVREVQGTITPVEVLLKENRTRKDLVDVIVNSELLLEEVPQREGSLILVPMILEHS